MTWMALFTTRTLLLRRGQPPRMGSKRLL